MEEENKGAIKILFDKLDNMTDKKALMQEVIMYQPIYYDNYKIWWMYEFSEFRWKRVDEVDIMNAIDKCAKVNVINSKERGELLEALKQVSRLNRPHSLEELYTHPIIQFKDKMIDIINGETQKVSEDIFVTNPIPWSLHPEGKTDTPNMDKLFEEWVGKDNVKTLYEILAYCVFPSYPINRIFCFIGSGMNGKSKFLELLRKFIGSDNCCSTELDTLLTSRFEITRLHKKLVCQMGETDFNEMSKTSILKKLSGGDLIGFEYKGKDHFEDINYAKILIATNNLPSTTDKTIGFYRRWMIIDFPNQFSEKKDVLLDIPDEEYEALAVKSVNILRELLEKREFTNEGSVEERIKKYEDHSNPLEKFLREYTIEDYDGYVWKHDFYEKLRSWCRENRFREVSQVEVGKKMKSLGFNVKELSADFQPGKRFRAYTGIKWRFGDEK